MARQTAVPVRIDRQNQTEDQKEKRGYRLLLFCNMGGHPMRGKKWMERICRRYSEILGEQLTGIYLHGSAAFGCAYSFT